MPNASYKTVERDTKGNEYIHTMKSIHYNSFVFVSTFWLLLLSAATVVITVTAAAWSVVPPGRSSRSTTTTTTPSSTATISPQHQQNDPRIIQSTTPKRPTDTITTTTTRRAFLPTIVATVATATTAILVVGPSTASAVDAAPNASSTNQNRPFRLSDDELLSIVRDDIVQRQFLVTGNITRSIYDPAATFTDEIDTYEMDQWMIGTQRLFVGDRSQVRLVNDKVTLTSPTTIEFLFDEDLMFNLPIFKPVVSLTGKVVLTRDPETGLVTSYREYWDQDVLTVLKSAKF